jgi:hypothetical protein
MNVGQLIPLVKGHQTVYDVSHCEHGDRDYVANVWLYISNSGFLMFMCCTHVTCLLAQLYSLHNCVQKKQVKIFLRSRLLVQCSKSSKNLSESRGID